MIALELLRLWSSTMPLDKTAKPHTSRTHWGTKVPHLSICILATLLFCLGCEAAGKRLQEEAYKQAIQKVMHDINLIGSQPTDEHVQTLQRLDLNDCPPEFRFAFAKYTYSWEEQVAVSKAKAKLGDDELPSAGAEMLSRLFDLDVQPWEEHQQAAQQVARLSSRANADLSSTAQDLNDLAVKYGVRINP